MLEVDALPALNSAAWNHQWEVVLWLVDNCDLDMVKALFDRGLVEDPVIFLDSAASRGHGTLKWFNGLHSNRTEGCSYRAMHYADHKGHLDVVKWLHANRSEGCTTDAMDYAAANGHLEVVKWLHDRRTEECIQPAMDKAAKYGHLDVVKWMHLNRSDGCSPKTIDRVTGNDHLEVVKWLHLNRSERCTSLAIKQFIKGSASLDTAVYLFSEFPECRAFQLRRKTKISRPEVVEWLLGRVPSALEGKLEVESWNWYICDWLRHNKWRVVAQESKQIVWFSR
ncbi:hypothetical protein JG687_00013328 [Phytophthora cactorum]|uniref:Ankyrin repeat-containing domain n=1 Tax=Phytophthora cactorum TaxID=29920 RepID=A0A8T1TZA0_9STRA|nr:hypothetical protein JG687_00013328 [Phytophthora cactorum]